MARKGSISNDDFLKQVGASAKKEIKRVEDVLSNPDSVSKFTASDDKIKDPGKKDDETEKKGIEYISIGLMDNAPDEWNRYPLLKDDQPERYLELKMSIYDRGIENPLVLWKQGERYMILAGHNRKDICTEIINECINEPGFDKEKYEKPKCIVYKEDELTEYDARAIIGDTNLYRDFSKLPVKTKIMITKDRMELYQRRRYAKGARIDQVARDLGMEKTSVYENLSIYEKVIPEIQELYYNGTLTRKSVLRFTSFDVDTQKWVYEKYKDRISELRVKKIRKTMTKDDLAGIFTSEDVKRTKRMTFQVPVGKEEEFQKLCEMWANGEININQ